MSADWRASGVGAEAEADKHPAAAHSRRPLRHTPVISFADAARLYANAAADPHEAAEDYIPVTSGAEKIFAVFVDDEAIDLAFPKNTIAVIDYADRRPADGSFGLFLHEEGPVIRRLRDDPLRLEPATTNPSYGPIYLDAPPKVIGCVRVSIRIH